MRASYLCPQSDADAALSLDGVCCGSDRAPTSARRKEFRKVWGLGQKDISMSASKQANYYTQHMHATRHALILTHLLLLHSTETASHNPILIAHQTSPFAEPPLLPHSLPSPNDKPCPPGPASASSPSTLTPWATACSSSRTAWRAQCVLLGKRNLPRESG